MNLKICMLLFCVLLVACKKKQEPVQQQPAKVHQLSLQQDSGFVTKKIGLPFLIAHQLADTTGNPWDNVQDNDTIAKYYKVKKTGHFYYCTIDYRSNDYETHLILELNQAGEVLQSERFYHGHYHCCWENRYEGFQKHGDYFGIKTCNTGSGLCGAHLSLFKTLMPQDSLESVLTYCWEAMGGEDRIPRRLSSFLTINKDTLLVHYTLEEGKIVDDVPHFKVQKTREFEVHYVLNKHRWIDQDSTLFKLGIFW